mgnify:CR=1 FL=1
MVLQRVQRDATQAAIAATMGVSDSTISRLLSDHLDKLALVLAHAGLKVVPTEYQCVDPRTAQAMATLYEAALRKVGNHVELLWDEPDEPP